MGIKGRIIHRLPHRKTIQPIKNHIYNTSIRNIFFDLDDTIIITQERYNNATKKCIKIMEEEFGLDKEERKNIKLAFKTYDAKRMIELKKFNINRFTYSWYDVYEEYCERFDKEINPSVKRKIKDITTDVWSPPFDIYEGVVETIKSLKTEFPISKIHILTLGDPDVQKEKIKSLPEEVRNHIDRIYVVENKSQKTFERVLKGLNPERCVMIGNSERSDIEPALNVGMKAIHMKNPTWELDKKKINTNHDNYNHTNDFTEIKEILQQL